MSQFVINAVWLFLGIVAGSLIQYFLNWLTFRKHRANAKRIFAVETAINRTELNKLKREIQRKKERFTAGQILDHDYFLDMSGFNYRIVDPLINTGHFHEILGPEGVARYMKYANELNVGHANNLINMLRTEDEAGRSLAFLDWLLETKVPEWEGHLGFVEECVGAANVIEQLEYSPNLQLPRS